MTETRDTHAQGMVGEQLAREYLEHCGLRIVSCNTRFGRGEIDIIAEEGEYLVFCEVKMRRSETFGSPEYAVTPAKQQQLRRLATGYLAQRHITDRACRFDVVAIEWSGSLPRIRHLRNAF
jgi:putative endonuclease